MLIINIYACSISRPVYYIWYTAGAPNQSFFAQAVVLLVLLVWWLEIPETASPYQVVEYFSGVARIATLSRYCGYTTAALDIEYGMQYAKDHGKRSPMDINSNAGLVLLDWILYVVFYPIGVASQVFLWIHFHNSGEVSPTFWERDHKTIKWFPEINI